jgi:hypothetical protein
MPLKLSQSASRSTTPEGGVPPLSEVSSIRPSSSGEGEKENAEIKALRLQQEAEAEAERLQQEAEAKAELVARYGEPYDYSKYYRTTDYIFSSSWDAGGSSCIGVLYYHVTNTGLTLY